MSGLEESILIVRQVLIAERGMREVVFKNNMIKREEKVKEIDKALINVGKIERALMESGQIAKREG